MNSSVEVGNPGVVLEVVVDQNPKINKEGYTFYHIQVRPKGEKIPNINQYFRWTEMRELAEGLRNYFSRLSSTLLRRFPMFERVAIELMVFANTIEELVDPTSFTSRIVGLNNSEEQQRRVAIESFLKKFVDGFNKLSSDGKRAGDDRDLINVSNGVTGKTLLFLLGLFP
jgi:hypothetical protein